MKILFALPKLRRFCNLSGGCLIYFIVKEADCKHRPLVTGGGALWVIKIHYVYPIKM